MTNERSKELILGAVEDLVGDFLYDRSEDEELSLEHLNSAIKDKLVTLDEVVDKFREQLEPTFKKLQGQIELQSYKMIVETPAISEALKNRPHSEEHKRKISESLKRRNKKEIS